MYHEAEISGVVLSGCMLVFDAVNEVALLINLIELTVVTRASHKSHKSSTT